MFQNGTSCVRTCTSIYDISGASPTCATTCARPKKTMLVNGKQFCVASCKDYGFLDVGTNCSGSCPGAMALVDGYYTCVTDCGAGNFIDKSSHIFYCVSACPS
jgi:hypothetical protein